MSKSFVQDIGPNSVDSHQTSPAWMITFVRWTNRDTLRMQAGSAAKDLSVSDPLIVINDCLSVTTSVSKGSQTPSMQCVMKLGDVNYLTSISPGDFVFVNMVEDETKILGLYNRAMGQKPINEVDDGFKGFFKVQSVREVIAIMPDGTKTLAASIDGFAFTEFNNSIYFNPYLVNEPEFKKDAIFVSNIGLNYKQLTGGTSTPSCQTINAFFIENFLGTGVPPSRRNIGGVDLNFNTLFYVPQLVGQLLGQNNAKAAKDLYLYLMGIQKYGTGGGNLGTNMNPILRNQRGRFYFTNQACEGVSLLKPEYWNQVTVWSILKQYLNAPINELYSCFRVSPDNRIMPTVVMRQIPFSTESYASGPVTKFLNLPRWKIDVRRIYNRNIGRDESARINFVQVFGQVVNSDKPDATIAMQIQKKNYVADTADIRRSGLRPYVITSNFDSIQYSSGSLKAFRSNIWARLLADSLIGGHLRLNGTLEFTGIEAPIAVGDNLELDSVVYHIEAISHSAQMLKDGKKNFRTTVQLSNGIDKNWTVSQPRYAEMDNTDMDVERQRQWGEEQLFGGSSDEQKRPGREDGIKVRSNNRSFTLAKRKTLSNPSTSRVKKGKNR